MVDGKTVVTTGPVYKPVRLPDHVLPIASTFTFLNHVGTDGQHFHARLIVDGKQGIEVKDIHTQNFVFSPTVSIFAALLDAYPARIEPEVVVDGKITNWPGGPPVERRQSARVHHRRGRSKTGSLPRWSVRRERQAASLPGRSANQSRPHCSPTQMRPCRRVRLKWRRRWRAPGTAVPGDKRQASPCAFRSSEEQGRWRFQIQNLLVSSDGKHYACHLQRRKRKDVSV